MDRPISTAVLQQVQNALVDGRKIEAIKLYRLDTGASLKDAKEAVDKLEAEWRVTSPEKFKAPQGRKGCRTLILIILALHLGLILFLLLSQRSRKMILERKRGETPASVQK